MIKNLFVVAGMPRGGTTFLYHNLNKHPGIFLPSCKEVNYYTVNWERGAEWYESLYASRANELWCGDISPPCFLDVSSITKIKKYNPDAKIVFCVRRPSDYALSFYSQFKTFTYNMPSFEEFVRDGYTYTRDDGSLRIRYLDDYIVKTVSAFMDAFGDDILLYKFDFFSEQTLCTLRCVEQFLGLDSYFNESNFDNLKINASNRGNFKLLSRILQSERSISAIQKICPHQMIIKARSIFDKVSAVKNTGRRMYSESDQRFAEDVLRIQDEKTDALFSGDSVITGRRRKFSIQ